MKINIFSEKSKDYLKQAMDRAVFCGSEVEEIVKDLSICIDFYAELLSQREQLIDRQDELIEGMCNHNPEACVKKLFNLPKVQGVTIEIEDVEASGRLSFTASETKSGKLLISGITAVKAPGSDMKYDKEEITGDIPDDVLEDYGL